MTNIWRITVLEVNGDQEPQCIICGEVFSNECMKHSKLQKHFNLSILFWFKKRLNILKIGFGNLVLQE